MTGTVTLKPTTWLVATMGETVARVRAWIVLPTHVAPTASTAGIRPALMKTRLYTQIATEILDCYMTESAIRKPTLWVAATMGAIVVSVPAWTHIITPAALTDLVARIQPV